MHGKKLPILSEDKAGEKIIGFAGEAKFLSLITNYIFHDEYLKFTLFSTIVYILHFTTHGDLNPLPLNLRFW